MPAHGKPPAAQFCYPVSAYGSFFRWTGCERPLSSLSVDQWASTLRLAFAVIGRQNCEFPACADGVAVRNGKRLRKRRAKGGQ
jgi:hypothetical protein